MTIFNDINKALNDELEPINEFHVDHPNTPSCTILGTIDKYTVIFVAAHVKERIAKRLRSLEPYGIKVKLSKLYQDIFKRVQQNYTDMLDAAGLSETKFPTVEKTSLIVYHIVYRLHVVDEVNGEKVDKGTNTLDIAVGVQCEPLRWDTIKGKFNNPKKEHQYLLDNVKFNFLQNAIKRLNMVLDSPIFTVGTVVTAYAPGMTKKGFSNKNALDHIDLMEKTLEVTSQQLKEIKKIVKETLH